MEIGNCDEIADTVWKMLPNVLLSGGPNRSISFLRLYFLQILPTDVLHLFFSFFFISSISLLIVEHIKAVLELSTTSEPSYLSTNTMKMCADALIKMILTEDVDVDFQKLLMKQAYILLVASTARNYLKSE